MSDDRDRLEEPEDGAREASKLVERGADLAGALAGGALALAGGPVGAIGGAALGLAIKHVALSVGHRLQARQRDRAGAALILIAADEHERHERGEAPRDDGFFDERGELRPEAEELLEAVLLHAANAYEERKVPFLAHLYDGVAHDPSVSAADAHALLAMAERLTYRQLVALAVLANDEHFRALARAASLRDEGRGGASPTLALELDALGDSGLIGVRVDGKGPFRVGEVFGSQGPVSGQAYGAIKLMPAGALLHRLMRLSEIDRDDQLRWLAELKGTDDGSV